MVSNRFAILLSRCRCRKTLFLSISLTFIIYYDYSIAHRSFTHIIITINTNASDATGRICVVYSYIHSEILMMRDCASDSLITLLE